MAVNGTTTVVVRSPEYLEVTWAVTTPVVNNYSDAINVRGYEIIEYYVSVYTGYTGATLTIGVLADMAQAVEGDGLIAESAGRHLRADARERDDLGEPYRLRSEQRRGAGPAAHLELDRVRQ